MTRRSLKGFSKYLSFILRHQPQSIGLELDEQGWADVSELLAKAGTHGKAIDLDTLLRVVETNDKKRFTLSPDRPTHPRGAGAFHQYLPESRTKGTANHSFSRHGHQIPGFHYSPGIAAKIPSASSPVH